MGSYVLIPHVNGLESRLAAADDLWKIRKHQQIIPNIIQRVDLEYFSDVFFWLALIIIKNPTINSIKKLPIIWRNVAHLWQRLTQNAPIQQSRSSFILGNGMAIISFFPLNLMIQSNRMKKTKSILIQTNFMKQIKAMIVSVTKENTTAFNPPFEYYFDDIYLNLAEMPYEDLLSNQYIWQSVFIV